MVLDSGHDLCDLCSSRREPYFNPQDDPTYSASCPLDWSSSFDGFPVNFFSSVSAKASMRGTLNKAKSASILDDFAALCWLPTALRWKLADSNESKWNKIDTRWGHKVTRSTIPRFSRFRPDIFALFTNQNKQETLQKKSKNKTRRNDTAHPEFLC